MLNLIALPICPGDGIPNERFQTHLLVWVFLLLCARHLRTNCGLALSVALGPLTQSAYSLG
jgi:hypothetical protein